MSALRRREKCFEEEEIFLLNVNTFFDKFYFFYIKIDHFSVTKE